MKYFYGEYDGEEFPTPDKLFSFDQLMDFIMQYGEQALKAIEQMMKDPNNEQQSDLHARTNRTPCFQDRGRRTRGARFGL